VARSRKRARRSSPLYIPGAFDLFTPSKDLVLKNIWIFGPLYAIPFIFWIHSWLWEPLPNQHRHWWQDVDGFSSAWPGGPVPSHLTFIFVGFSLFWFLLILFAGTAVQIMSQRAQLNATEGKSLDFDHLWRAVRDHGFKMLGLYIVSGLAIVFSLFILSRNYLLAPYVMLERKTGILESMKLSSEISAKNSGSVWGVIGVLFLIGLLNILPIVGGLVAFVVGSLYSIAPALRYQQLKNLN
jgi:hypothetical protein